MPRSLYYRDDRHRVSAHCRCAFAQKTCAAAASLSRKKTSAGLSTKPIPDAIMRMLKSIVEYSVKNFSNRFSVDSG